ncbi:MAG TPA: S4 domain-containing protein, partial [Daejeonella sp.]
MTEENDVQELEEQDLYEHLRIVVDKGQSLLRLDKFLIIRTENTSRNRIQNAIDAGNVLVNDKIIKASYKVKPLDVVSLV